MSGPELSHRDAGGRVHMVDVGAKPITERIAVAAGHVRCRAQTLALLAQGSAKGEVLGTAEIAGLMAAKRTAELIPLCHPIGLTQVTVSVTADPRLPGVRIEAAARCIGQTGVEMEALTAVTVAGLTVIDMLKSADPWMTIEDVGLISKSGGRSGDQHRP